MKNYENGQKHTQQRKHIIFSTWVVQRLAQNSEGASNSVRFNHDVVVSLELHAALPNHLVTVCNTIQHSGINVLSIVLIFLNRLLYFPNCLFYFVIL